MSAGVRRKVKRMSDLIGTANEQLSKYKTRLELLFAFVSLVRFASV